MNDRDEYETFAYEFRRKAESTDSPVVRDIWNMVADRWAAAGPRREQQAGEPQPG